MYLRTNGKKNVYFKISRPYFQPPRLPIALETLVHASLLQAIKKVYWYG